MIKAKELGKLAKAYKERAPKPLCKARKGDMALVEFTSVITTKDFKTTCRAYYKFCVAAHCDRSGRVLQVYQKDDDALYPVTGECFIVPAEKCNGLNVVHFLGNEYFNTPDKALVAIKALIATHAAVNENKEII